MSRLKAHYHWYYHSTKNSSETSFPTLEEDSARFPIYFLHLCFAPGASQLWSELRANRQGLAHYLPYFGRKPIKISHINPSLVIAFCVWSQVSFHHLKLCSLPKQPSQNCY